jgi:4-amino-4-deoxy-L-arabinose transferase-like glycosyltransferase
LRLIKTQDWLLTNLKYILLSVLVCFIVFGNLTSYPIQIWDEARLAINAYEMFENGNYLITHFNGVPDMWNTKPPLMIWLQVLFMKIFGINEFAVRLPSALAAVLTCGFLVYFSVKYLKNFWIGFFSVLVLITAQGYIRMHVTRTGDYDSLLVLFTTVSSLCFLLFIQYKEKKQLYLFFITLAFAVLTKSAAGLLFTPALLLYALWQKQVYYLLKNKHFYIGILLFLTMTLGYYLLRENYNPGYISAVLENEWGGRYLKVVEAHNQGVLFYFGDLVVLHFSEWIYFVPCGLLLGFFSTDLKFKKLAVFISIMILTHLFVISISKTKLEWYSAPQYPLLAIAVAVCIHFIYRLLKQVSWKSLGLRYNIIPTIIIFLVFIFPLKKIIGVIYLQEIPNNEDYEMGYFLKDAVEGKYNVNNTYVLSYALDDHLDEYYIAHNLFYVKKLQDQGYNVSFKDWEKLQQGDTVIATQEDIKQFIEDNYSFTIISETGNLIMYKIIYRNENFQTFIPSVKKHLK